MLYVVYQLSTIPLRYLAEAKGKSGWTVTKSQRQAAIFPTKKAAREAILSLVTTNKRFWTLTDREALDRFRIDRADAPRGRLKEAPKPVKERRTLWDRLVADDGVV